MEMKAKIQKQIQERIQLFMNLLEDDHLIAQVEEVVEILVSALKNGNKVMIAGNGGSAADAQHMAGEFVGRFYHDRDPLPAIALTTDSSVLTSVGNDYGFKQVFSRQIQALGNRGDVFLAISTSGDSANILRAREVSKKKSILTIGLTGNKKGKMNALCNHLLEIPSDDTAQIQECHLVIEHMICGLVENKVFHRETD